MKPTVPILAIFLCLAAQGARASNADFTIESPAGPAPGKQEAPDAAWNGTSWFVAWLDEREPGHSMPVSSIRGTRVALDGEPLDAGGIAIAVVPPGIVKPVVVACGSKWLVVWADAAEVLAARIDASGRLLDAKPIAVTNVPGQQMMPAAVCAGSTALVVWGDQRVPKQVTRDIYAARLDVETGKVLDPNGKAFAAGDGGRFYNYPSVAWNGDRFLIAWHLHADMGRKQTIEGIRLAKNLEVIDEKPLQLSGGQHGEYPKAAASGDSFLVIFSRATPDNAKPEVRAALVPASGMPSADAKIGAGPQPQITGAPGGGWVVGWLGGGSQPVELVRVDRELKTGPVRPVGKARQDPARPAGGAPNLVRSFSPMDVAAGGDAMLVTWGDIPTYWMYPTGYAAGRDAGAGEVMGMPLALATPPGSASLFLEGIEPAPRRLSTGAPQQLQPRLALDGKEWAVAWLEKDGTSTRVMAAHLAKKGFREKGGIMVTAEGAGVLQGPNIAAGGGIALVTWTATEGTLAARIDSNGKVLDVPPLVAGPQAAIPAVGFDGTRFVLAWGDGNKIHVRAVAPDGTMEKEIVFDGGPFATPRTQVACVPGRCVVLWRGNHGVDAVTFEQSLVSRRTGIAHGYTWDPKLRVAGNRFCAGWQEQPDDGADVPDDVFSVDFDGMLAPLGKPHALLSSRKDEFLLGMDHCGRDATLLWLEADRVQSGSPAMKLRDPKGRVETLPGGTTGDVCGGPAGPAVVWTAEGRLRARVP